MSDIRRTIELIRASLHSADLTVTGELREAADVYAEACKQANDRLLRCEEMLRQGLREEALRQAELDPDLLQLTDDLNFPERDLWDERLLLNDLNVPSSLNLRAAELLGRAYAEKAPLAELLKQHRLLALARAPLRERVGIVRLLAQAE